MDFPYRRPLLATEHGEFDVGAEALAFALARRHALPLDAVLPLPSNPEFEATAPAQAARAEAQAATSRIALQQQAAAQGVALDLRVRRGPDLHAEIVAEARERTSDLIVIRRRGQRGFLANLLVGEMVSRVIAHAPCSVLVAPRAAQLWRAGVLVGVDPEAPGAGMVAHAARLAAAGGVPLTLLAVAAREPGLAAAEQSLSALLPPARALGVQVRAEVRHGRVADALAAAARECGADLLVVGRRTGPPVRRALIGSNATRLLGAATGPVLVHIENTSP
ncbi:MAG TPA: universal stress protein [Burkholderiaceae bacterium]|nr:universal stress protein [Burkholderiaceae bacterium]